MNEGSRARSLFPIKLLVIYLVVISLLPTFFMLWDLGNVEESTELWNPILALSLILCTPLLFVISLSIWYFRRMPYFASIFTAWSILIIAETVGSYYGQGFDSRFDVDLSRINLIGLFGCFFCIGLPFILTYFIWRFWPQKKSVPDSRAVV